MCYSASSYSRLLDLARRTGDRLIIHNELENEDIVMMSVDEYERLWEKQKSEKIEVRGLSERGLIDKINRDIAIWRADKDLEDEWENEEMWNEEMRRHDWDFGHEPWHSVGDVVKSKVESGKYKVDDLSDWNFEEDEDDNEIGKLGNWEMNSKQEAEIKVDDISDFSWEKKENYAQASEDYFSTVEEEPKKVPFKNETIAGNLQEEPLGEDEPVFYEEPV